MKTIDNKCKVLVISNTKGNWCKLTNAECPYEREAVCDIYKVYVAYGNIERIISGIKGK